MWVSLASGATLALATLAFSLETAEPQQAKWTAILVCGAMGLLLVRRVSLLGVLILAMMAWGLLSLQWSADWRNGIVVMTHAGALLGCSLLAVRAAHVAPLVLGAGMVFASIVWTLGPDWLFGGFGNRNFAAEFVLLAAPFAWFSPIRWWALASGAILLIDNHGALKWLAATGVVSGLALYPAWKRGDWGPAIVSGVAATALVLIFLPERVSQSLLARVEIGWNTLAMIADRPLFGWGLGSFNAVYPDYSERHRAVIGDWTVLESPTRFAGASHNEFLQLHAELGLVGWVLFLACIAVLLRYAWSKKRDDLDRASLLSLLICAFLALISFPLQNAATAMATGLSVAILARGQTVWIVPRAGLLATGAVASFLLWTAPQVHWASFYYGVAVRLGNVDPRTALVYDLKAIEAWPYLRGPRHQLELLLSGALEKGGIEIDRSTADRWHRISVSAAGNDPAVLMSRLAYLASVNEFDGQEARQTLVLLAERHSLRPGVKALAHLR